MNTTTPGYMTDSKGRLVPDSMVKPIDKLRDQTVQKLIEQAKALNAHLRTFKAAAFGDIAAMIETSAEQYEAKIGGEKGYVTLYSYDGRYKVQRAVQEEVRFDEQLLAAKALIDECITSWSHGSSDEIKVLVNDAFRVNQEGHVRTQQVLGLRRLDIKNPKWLRAMDAISNAVTVVGSKSYVRFYERVGETDQYRPINLDMASV